MVSYIIYTKKHPRFCVWFNRRNSYKVHVKTTCTHWKQLNKYQ